MWATTSSSMPAASVVCLGRARRIPLVTNYGSHKITEQFNVMTFFPLVRSVTPAQLPAAGHHVEKLLSSNERSWGETDMKSHEASLRRESGYEGPVSLWLSLRRRTWRRSKKARMIVYGDSDFASKWISGMQGNGNLFLNSVSWLAQDESFISIRPKNPTDRRLTMTEAQSRMVSYVCFVFLPISILIAGISVWMNRRK